MNNTDQNSVLKNKKTRRALIVGGSLMVFSLIGLFSSKARDKNVIDNYQNYNSETTVKTVDEMIEENEEFDNNFKDLQNMDKIKIGDKEYDLNRLTVVKNSDGKAYLKKTGGENVDILTNKEFSDDSVSICFFKDSSIFYDLYVAGMLDKDGIKNTKDVSVLLNTWNGEEHSHTLEVLSEKDIYNQIHKGIGR